MSCSDTSTDRGADKRSRWSANRGADRGSSCARLENSHGRPRSGRLASPPNQIDFVLFENPQFHSFT
ncbi:hypothetical protein SAMN06295900_1203 [Trinickia caryophylli]|uniref:Uncharacterized protein n=1 Tax=Trinickia caryophylli TaxID=28094 RepID=A0A1X7H277_TRICW|nr:hypothetical protein SAMN06295900_1203 [Trinickia caryophylli]